MLTTAAFLSLNTQVLRGKHRRRSDWNSGGTHGGTYYKSPAVEAKKHIFLHCNASNLVLKSLQHDKIWGGDNPPTLNSGGGTCPPPRDLRPWKQGSLQTVQSVPQTTPP